LVENGARSSLVSSLFLGLSFFDPPPTALLGRGVAAQFVFGFGDQVGDFDGTTVPINRNERQIARVCVSTLARRQVFRLDADAHFH
jgi:hypothetical protein